MENLILSIIIPTKNRQQYCIESIKAILLEIDDRCEVVIQDNSDEDTLKDLVNNLCDKRVRYSYTSEQLSLIDNFEDALNSSKGEYFCILGDDDCVVNNIVTVIEWMKSNNIESVCSRQIVEYVWPNPEIEKYKNGYLSIPNYTGTRERIDTIQTLKTLMQNGIINYQQFFLPRTYHGIVKKTSMDLVKEKTGKYFGGLTPDIYTTVALSCVVTNHFVIDLPFSIAGACPASATISANIGQHSGKLADAPHFKNQSDYQWENIIPKFYSIETIWAESAIKALKAMERLDLIEAFNKSKFYAFNILANLRYTRKIPLQRLIFLVKLSVHETIDVVQFSVSSQLSLTKKMSLVTIECIKVMVKEIIKTKKRQKHITNIANLKECLHTLSDYLTSRNNL